MNYMTRQVYPDRWFAWTIAIIFIVFLVTWGAVERYSIELNATYGGATAEVLTSAESQTPTGRITLRGSYSRFYKFPKRFFNESSVPIDQILKVTDAQYLSLRSMHNGLAPYTFTRIEYDKPVYGVTTPTGIKVGDAAFPKLNGSHPRWEVMAHEGGHNFFGGTSSFYSTLATPYPFLQESFAVLSAFYTYHTIVQNQAQYGLTDATIKSLRYDFKNGRAYQKQQYNLYISNGKHFDIKDVLTSQALDYKMVMLGEQYGWRNYKKFTKAFDPDIEPSFTFQKDGVSDIEQSTYVIAALSVAFRRDFRKDFKELNFPVDETLYADVLQKITLYINR